MGEVVGVNFASRFFFLFFLSRRSMDNALMLGYNGLFAIYRNILLIVIVYIMNFWRWRKIYQIINVMIFI